MNPGMRLRAYQAQFSVLLNSPLEARIALRNRRAHAAVQKLGARRESTLTGSSQTGIPGDPEVVWTLRSDDWRTRTHDSRVSVHDARRRIRKAVEAAQSELQRSESPETVEPYPVFLFDLRLRE